jgi:lipopolysaccharide export system ATP-binding protein
VFLNDINVTDWPLFRRAAEGGMGYLAQESSVFRKLTVEQNILAVYELLGVPYRERKQRTQKLLEDFEITHIRRSKAGRLSGGERRRLEIARCLVSDPKIIMLDEPFAGIDPVTVQNIQEIIAKLRERGIAILITDHAAREILQTVDRCYVISKGAVMCEGTPETVRQHPEVRREYLGDIGIENLAPRGSDLAPPPTTARSARYEPQAVPLAPMAAVDSTQPVAKAVPRPFGLFRSSTAPTPPAASPSASSSASSPPAGSTGPTRQRPVRRRTDV